MEDLRLNKSKLFSSLWPGWGYYFGDFDMKTQEWQGEGIILTRDEAWLVNCAGGKIITWFPIPAIDQPPDRTKILLEKLDDARPPNLRADNAVSSEDSENNADASSRSPFQFPSGPFSSIDTNPHVQVNVSETFKNRQAQVQTNVRTWNAQIQAKVHTKNATTQTNPWKRNAQIQAKVHVQNAQTHAGLHKKKDVLVQADIHVHENVARKRNAQVQVNVQQMDKSRPVQAPVNHQKTVKKRQAHSQVKVDTRNVQTQAKPFIKNAVTQAGRPKQKDVLVQVNVQVKAPEQEAPGLEIPNPVLQAALIVDLEGANQPDVSCTGELESGHTVEPQEIKEGEMLQGFVTEVKASQAPLLQQLDGIMKTLTEQEGKLLEGVVTEVKASQALLLEKIDGIAETLREQQRELLKGAVTEVKASQAPLLQQLEEIMETLTEQEGKLLKGVVTEVKASQAPLLQQLEGIMKTLREQEGKLLEGVVTKVKAIQIPLLQKLEGLLARK